MTQDPHQEARQDQELHLETAYAPAFYRDPMTGPGRWFVLYAHGHPLGLIWTNDADGLGFIPANDAGIARTPELAQAFSRAKAAGTPATDVFAYYADLAGLGLQAGEVRTGTLDTLAD